MKKTWKEKVGAQFTHNVEKTKKSERALSKKSMAFRADVLKAASESSLDIKINEEQNLDGNQNPLSNDKSFFTYDIFKEVSLLAGKIGKDAMTCRLMGVAVTAPVKDLVDIGREGQNLATLLEETHEGQIQMKCLGIFPPHILSCFSPQSIFNITETLLEPEHSEKESSAQKLREYLAPCSVFANLDQENEDVLNRVTTAVLVMAYLSPEKLPAPSLTWGQHTKKWSHEQGRQALFSTYLPWPEAIVESFIQQSFFSWGAEARARDDMRSVLFVDNITVSTGSNVTLKAYVEDDEYGQSTLDPEVAAWPLDIVIQTLEERGISVD